MASIMAENFMVNLRCKRPGHENMPILYVCGIQSCKDRLNCATCMISTHVHHEKNLINIKQFLANYLTLEEDRDKILRENQKLAIAYEADENARNAKAEQEQLIDDIFGDLMKMTKILYDNTQDKFKMHNKAHHDHVNQLLEETEVILRSKEPSVKEQVQTCQTNNWEQVENLCESLIKNHTLHHIEQLSIREATKSVPKIDVEKAQRVKDEIIEYVKDKLRKLMEQHGLRGTDSSWHSRSAEMLHVYTGHTDHVMDLCLLNDGSLVSCSKDKTIRFWDTETNTCKGSIMLHDKNLHAIECMQNGNLVIAKDNIIKIYNPIKEEFEKSLTGHVKTVFALCPLKDGNLLSAGQDQVIKYWNVKTGQLLQSFYGHNDFIRRLKMINDKHLLSASDDKSIKIWHIDTGEILYSYDEHQDYVYAIDFMRNGMIVTGSRDGTVTILDFQRDMRAKYFKAHSNFIYAISVLLDNTIATASADNSIRIWDVSQFLENFVPPPGKGPIDLKIEQPVKKLEGHKFPVRGLQILNDGNLASCAEDNTIIVWASKKLEVKHTLLGHSKAVWCVAQLPNDRVISGSEDRTLKIWDTVEGKCLKTLTGHKDQVRCVYYLKGTNYMASGSSDKTIKIWDATDGSLINTITGHDGGVRSLSQTSEGHLVSGAEDKLLKIWDTRSWNCVQTIAGHDDYVRVVQGLSGNKLATGSRDNTLRIWNASTGKQELTFKGHGLPVWTICEIQPQKVLGTGSADFTIKIWDTEIGRAISTLVGHSGAVWSLVKLNETLIASGSEDSMIKIWDWEYGDCVRTMLSHSSPVWGLAVDDQENMASASWDKTVKIWTVKQKMQPDL